MKKDKFFIRIDPSLTDTKRQELCIYRRWILGTELLVKDMGFLYYADKASEEKLKTANRICHLLNLRSS